MADADFPPLASFPEDAGGSAEERLERGEVLFHPVAPFALPDADDRAFLLAQQTGGLGHKNISLNPATGEATGFLWRSAEQAERLQRVLDRFSRSATAWLAESLPHYRGGCEPDRASLRTEEEATRRLRLNARNDLLHIDAFPNRPARDRRILRVFANINPSEPRIWATTDPLPRLLTRYRKRIERHGSGLLRQLSLGFRNLLQPWHARCSSADVFMLRLHDYLKRNLKFQQTGPRRLWKFPPGSVWLAMTDGCCHAELRGRYALEQSYFIAPQVLMRPDLAPAALLRAA